ncbi:hypothetical protein [uncultured Mediterranean phage uvMED]|nr:hypothetical protein [uncultured Mediterranean phage uvMED]
MLSINQILFLKKNGITTLNQLAIMQFCVDKKSLVDVQKSINITRVGVDKFCNLKHNDKKRNLIKFTEEKSKEVKIGRPIKIAVITTAKGKKVLDKLETIV